MWIRKIIKSPEYKVDTEIQNISVQGKLLSYEKYRYYMLYKPAGVVSATTDRRDQTVLDLIPELKGQDYFPVGRLDKDTVGLLLITNDGPLAHRLLSPAHHVDKIYEAKIQGMADQTDIEKFAAGVEIGEKKPCAPAKLQILSVDEKTQTSYISLTIHEGKFHQVKRMFHALGKEVTFLKQSSDGQNFLWMKRLSRENTENLQKRRKRNYVRGNQGRDLRHGRNIDRFHVGLGRSRR